MVKQDIKKIYLPEIVGKGYKDYWNSRHFYCACKGSRGSKKSKTTALWLIYNIMKYPEANALCVRRYQNTLRNSCFSDLEWAAEKLGVSHLWNFPQSMLEITYKPTNQKILFRGMDDGLKVTSISVPKGVLCWVWVEEAYEITSESDFDKLDMSIRGEVPKGLWKQIRLTFNPWSEQSWLKPRFFDKPDELTFTKTTTFRCNEWLDDTDRLKFEKMKINNPRRFRIEGDGEWGIAEGLIYTNFEQADFDIDEVRKIPGIKSAFSLDFGFTSPNAFICSMVDNNAKIIYVFDEWYQTGTTNQKIAEQIKAMGYGGQRIVCDSAEPKSIRELCDCGLRAEPSRKGRDSVNHGIQQIQNYKIIVHARNCPEFWKEINNYCWKKDKFDKPTDIPEHEFSHGMDSLRYGVADLLQGDTYTALIKEREVKALKKKLFISQPMNGKTNEEILAVREKAIKSATDYLGEEVEVIDSFFKDAPHDAKPLWFLGKSLELLSTADVAYFAKGWENARGCVIENKCAIEYGIDVIEDYND